jgi:hypothetical protein
MRGKASDVPLDGRETKADTGAGFDLEQCIEAAATAQPGPRFERLANRPSSWAGLFRLMPQFRISVKWNIFTAED